MMNELGQLHRKGVFTPVSYESLSNKQKVKVLRTIMFLKRKRCGRLKSRLVADGRGQERNECGIDVSSPIVAIESIFMIAAIGACNERIIVTVDVEGAYLHCDMIGFVVVELDSTIAGILITGLVTKRTLSCFLSGFC
jgi:hypothetical protein